MFFLYENLPKQQPPTTSAINTAWWENDRSSNNNTVDHHHQYRHHYYDAFGLTNETIWSHNMMTANNSISMISNLQNRSGDEGEISLQYVNGISMPTGSVFISHQERGRLAYAAGCTIVIVDSELKQQSHIINNSSKNEIVSLAFSADGNAIAAGESGHSPAVRIWDLASKQEYAAFVEHKYAIPFVAFSPDKKYLVSVGNQNDQTIVLWNVERKFKAYPAKTTSKVNGLSFSPDSSHFITVGVRCARIWYIRENEIEHSVCLEGMSPQGPISTKIFTAVTYVTSSYIVAATAKSLLQITLTNNSNNNENGTKSPASRKTSGRWRLVETTEKKIAETKMIFALLKNSSSDNLFVACSNGVIKVFNANNLDLLETPPSFRPSQLGGEDFAGNTARKYGDAVAMAFVDENLLASVYSDHSIYVWDVGEIENIKRVSFSMYHASSIFDVDICPAVDGAILPGVIATCSNDSTIRFWKQDDRTLLKTIYCDSDLTTLCDSQADENLRKRNENDALVVSPPVVKHNLLDSPILPRPLSKQVSLPSSTLLTSLPVISTKLIVNTIAFRPDGRELAAGYRNGYIRIFDLSNFSVIHESKQDAEEILVLAYSQLGVTADEKQNLPQFLAISGGSFQNLALLTASNGYSLQQTFKSGHSSFVNGLRFAQSKKDFELGKCWLVSSSQAKLLVFHEAKLVSPTEDPGITVRFKSNNFYLVRSVSLSCSPHYMLINKAQDTIALACHDRKVRLVDISSGKIICSYLGTNVSSKISHQMKRFDYSNDDNVLVTACSDKTISLLSRPWDIQEDPQANEWSSKQGFSERVLSMANGHGNCINGVKILPCQQAVTVSADSCIFFWKYSAHLAPAVKPKSSASSPRQPKSYGRRTSAFASSTTAAAAVVKDGREGVARSFSARTIKEQEKRPPTVKPAVKPAWNRATSARNNNFSYNEVFLKRKSTALSKQTKQQQFKKAVDNLVDSINNVCNTFNCGDLEQKKMEPLIAASRKLTTFLENKTETMTEQNNIELL